MKKLLELTVVAVIAVCMGTMAFAQGAGDKKAEKIKKLRIIEGKGDGGDHRVIVIDPEKGHHPFQIEVDDDDDDDRDEGERRRHVVIESDGGILHDLDIDLDDIDLEHLGGRIHEHLHDVLENVEIELNGKKLDLGDLEDLDCESLDLGDLLDVEDLAVKLHGHEMRFPGPGAWVQGLGGDAGKLFALFHRRPGASADDGCGCCECCKSCKDGCHAKSKPRHIVRSLPGHRGLFMPGPHGARPKSKARARVKAPHHVFRVKPEIKVETKVEGCPECGGVVKPKAKARSKAKIRRKVHVVRPGGIAEVHPKHGAKGKGKARAHLERKKKRRANGDLDELRERLRELQKQMKHLNRAIERLGRTERRMIK